MSNESLKEKGSKSKKFLNKVSLKFTRVDTRSFMEKLRDFFENRYSYSLYIWPQNSRYIQVK